MTTVVVEPAVEPEAAPSVREPTYPFLLKACELLDERGWWGYTRSCTSSNELCLLGAVAVAHGHEPDDYDRLEGWHCDEYMAMQRAAGWHSALEDWNDNKALGVEAVKQVLIVAAYDGR